MKYLKDVLNQLPKNCIFDKINTGCGGTTMALESKENYIILVPYVTNVNAKLAKANKAVIYKSDDMFCIPETYTTAYISEGKGYEEIGSATKILATYESLPSIMQKINPEDWNLLVDEAHHMIKSYELRRDAIYYIAENYDKFQSYCFMTATVPAVLPNWMCWMSIVKAPLEEEKANIVLSNKLTKYCFYNSPSEIAKLYENGDKVFCSKNRNDLNQLPFKPADIKDGFSDKRNWFSSVGFESIDIDEVVDEITVIVNENKNTTIVDKDDLTQIVGRFRNCRPTVNLYIIKGKGKTINPITKEQLLGQVEILDVLNQMAKIRNNKFVEFRTYQKMYNCITYYEGEFRLDSNIVKYYQYLINKKEQWNEFGKTVTPISNSKKDVKKSSIKLDQLKSIDEIDKNNKNYQLISKGIDTIGIENVRRCRTIKTLKSRLIDLSDKLDHQKVQEKLNLKVGEFYSLKLLKEKMKSIDLQGTATKTIGTYYYVEEKSQYVNGIKTKGLKITGIKG